MVTLGIGSKEISAPACTSLASMCMASIPIAKAGLIAKNKASSSESRDLAWIERKRILA